MSKKLVFAFLALAFVAGSAFAVPAKADWDHHHHDIVYRDYGHHRYRGYWHNGVFINLGLADVPVAYAPYEPYYAPPAAYYPPPPAYYYPPAPAYYAPAYYPAYYPTTYFMGMPVTGVGIGLNFRIK